MIGGLSVAAWSVGGLLFAQLLSGVFMTSLEGTIDARVAETVPEQVTAGMAWAGAVRALGSAAAAALAPTAIAVGGLGAASGFSGAVLAAIACVGLIDLVGGARRAAAVVSPRMPG